MSDEEDMAGCLGCLFMLFIAIAVCCGCAGMCWVPIHFIHKWW